MMRRPLFQRRPAETRNLAFWGQAFAVTIGTYSTRPAAEAGALRLAEELGALFVPEIIEGTR